MFVVAPSAIVRHRSQIEKSNLKMLIYKYIYFLDFNYRYNKCTKKYTYTNAQNKLKY